MVVLGLCCWLVMILVVISVVHAVGGQGIWISWACFVVLIGILVGISGVGEFFLVIVAGVFYSLQLWMQRVL